MIFLRSKIQIYSMLLYWIEKKIHININIYTITDKFFFLETIKATLTLTLTTTYPLYRPDILLHARV